jgi:hypothetical protein
MKQGAARHALRDRKDDLYETPACCVTSAFSAGVFSDAGSVIWEPCAGRGAISRELRAFGFRVIAQDLVDHFGRDADVETGIDFLMERRAPEGVTAIITNPPFKLADEFVDHALGLVPRVIVLLRFMAFEGVDGKYRGSGLRSKLMDHHLRHLWVGADRPPAMHREGWTGRKLSGSGAPFAWFDFSARPKGRHDPISLHRFRWRSA